MTRGLLAVTCFVLVAMMALSAAVMRPKADVPLVCRDALVLAYNSDVDLGMLAFGEDAEPDSTGIFNVEKPYPYVLVCAQAVAPSGTRTPAGPLGSGT